MKQYGETTAFKVYFYKVVADFPTDSLQYMQASCRYRYRSRSWAASSFTQLPSVLSPRETNPSHTLFLAWTSPAYPQSAPQIPA